MRLDIMGDDNSTTAQHDGQVDRPSLSIGSFNIQMKRPTPIGLATNHIFEMGELIQFNYIRTVVESLHRRFYRLNY